MLFTLRPVWSPTPHHRRRQTYVFSNWKSNRTNILLHVVCWDTHKRDEQIFFHVSIVLATIAAVAGNVKYNNNDTHTHTFTHRKPKRPKTSRHEWHEVNRTREKKIHRIRAHRAWDLVRCRHRDQIRKLYGVFETGLVALCGVERWSEQREHYFGVTNRWANYRVLHHVLFGFASFWLILMSCRTNLSHPPWPARERSHDHWRLWPNVKRKLHRKLFIIIFGKEQIRDNGSDVREPDTINEDNWADAVNISRWIHRLRNANTSELSFRFIWFFIFPFRHFYFFGNSIFGLIDASHRVMERNPYDLFIWKYSMWQRERVFRLVCNSIAVQPSIRWRRQFNFGLLGLFRVPHSTFFIFSFSTPSSLVCTVLQICFWRWSGLRGRKTEQCVDGWRKFDIRRDAFIVLRASGLLFGFVFLSSPLPSSFAFNIKYSFVVVFFFSAYAFVIENVLSVKWSVKRGNNQLVYVIEIFWFFCCEDSGSNFVVAKPGPSVCECGTEIVVTAQKFKWKPTTCMWPFVVGGANRLWPMPMPIIEE